MIKKFTKFLNKNEEIEYYNSGIKSSTDLEVNALVLILQEAEKKLEVIEKSIERTQLKAKQYINYCSLVVTGLIASLKLSYESTFMGLEFKEMLTITLPSLSIFLISIWVSFTVLGRQTRVGTIGKTPKSYLKDLHILKVKDQYRFSLLNTIEQHQTSIDQNAKISNSKSDHLNQSYFLMKTAVAAYVILAFTVIFS